MTFVYVLVSNEKDTYYEQTMISAKSLLKYNNDAKVVIIVDQGTIATFTGKRSFHENLGVEIREIKVPEEYNNRDRSRFLKTTMYNYIDEDFLFIDGDTLICDELKPDFSGDANGNISIGMVLDRHQRISENSYKNFYDLRAKPLGWSSGYQDLHFNSGVIWVKKSDNAQKFFDEWHKLWKETLEKYSVVYDQTALNEVNVRLNGIVKEIDGTWNCQATRRSSFLKYLHNAKIMHYYASFGLTCFDLANKEVQKTILNDSHKALDIIMANPKVAFSSVQDVNADLTSVKIQRTALYRAITFMYKRLGFAYRVIDKACGLFIHK
ncbi:MAG: glycosyltransferase [Fibrobacter sp.]|nr:glycosyltransferase [Fibrobacter sp.]